MQKLRSAKKHNMHHTEHETSAQVQVGSGSAKKSRQLSFRLLAVLFVVVFGGLGSYLIFASHADTTKVDCSKLSTTKYNCTFYETAPIKNSANKQVGTIPSGINYIYCQQVGGEVTVGSYHNDWWAWTDSNQGTTGWVNAVYGKGGVNDGGFAAAPNCNNAHGAAPLTPAPAPAPKPAPAPAPAPVKTTTPPKTTPAPTPTPAKPAATTISGKVYDSTTGKGIPNVKINTCNTTTGVLTTKTDGTWSAATTVGTPFCAELQYTAPTGWTGPVLIGTAATSYEHQTAVAKNQSYDFKFTSPPPAAPKAAAGHVIVSGKVYNATTSMPAPNIKISTCTTPSTVTTGIDGMWYLQVTDGGTFCAKLASAVPAGWISPVLNNNPEHKTATDYESQVADANDYHSTAAALKGTPQLTWDRSVDTDYNFVFATAPAATTPAKTTTTAKPTTTTTAPAPTPAKAVTTGCKTSPAHGKCSDGKTTCNTGYKVSGSKCVINNDVVVAIPASAVQDGCGYNATHYYINPKTKKKEHVGQKNYGQNSVCICNGGQTVAYGKALTDSEKNTKCPTYVISKRSSGSTSGVGSSAGEGEEGSGAPIVKASGGEATSGSSVGGSGAGEEGSAPVKVVSGRDGTGGTVVVHKAKPKTTPSTGTNKRPAPKTCTKTTTEEGLKVTTTVPCLEVPNF